MIVTEEIKTEEEIQRAEVMVTEIAETSKEIEPVTLTKITEQVQMIETTAEIQEIKSKITIRTPEIEEEEIRETMLIIRTVMTVLALAKTEKIEALLEMQVSRKIVMVEKEVEVEDIALALAVLIGMILVTAIPRRVMVTTTTNVKKIGNGGAKVMLLIEDNFLTSWDLVHNPCYC